MDNLKQLRIRFLPVQDIKGNVINLSIEEDKEQKQVFFLREDCLYYVDLMRGEEYIIVYEIQDVIRVEYMTCHDKISISTKRSVLIVDCDTKDLYEKEFDEIQQTAWSHSYEYLTVLFKTGQLRTYLFDERGQMIDHGEGDIFATVPQQQSIGWGSNMTQFQGPSIISPKSESVTEPHLTPTDDGTPTISWRRNAEEFVVSFKQDELRIFKTFDANCVPKCCSELSSEVGKLYGPIAWKPEGYVIAAAMFQDNKNCIALFERNGLYRLAFPLVDIFYPITCLCWSPCGRILTVSHKDDSGNTHLCFYVTYNMKWFLKQHLVFYKKNPLIRFDWMQTDPQCLELQTVTTKLVTHYKYRFGFNTDSKNNMIAAVNGRTIRIHGFLKSVDPSPSCTSTITTSDPINMIAFHPSNDFLAAVDSSNNIYCFKINGIDLNCIVRYSLTKETFPLRANHLFWKAENPHILIDNPSDCCSTLYEFCVGSEELVKEQIFDVAHGAIEHIYAVDNMVVKHDARYRTTHRVKETPITTESLGYALEVIPFKLDDNIFFFVLTPDQDLYLEDELICKGITSIILYEDYLLLTDTTNLYTLQLNSQVLDSLPLEGLSVFHCRPLNELSYLMCMLSDTSQVILHTPRGNLEIIGCRPMQVRDIEKMLTNGEWGAAIKQMRLSRTNWNLLIDLNPDRFYANLSKIVSESNSQHTLNAIVSEISDENCLTTVYKNTFDFIPYTSSNKRHEFLKKLSEYLDESGAFANYLPTVIKICMDQNNIQKVLTYLSFLINSPSDKQQRKAEEALKQMKMHVEPMDLFKAALFTYDINLADYVARICQINPQEVASLLEDLRKLDGIERRIAVNVRYQNWEMAVAYMFNKENRDKDEILTFIQEHDVAKRAYVEAIKIKELDFMEDVAKLYADKLIQNKHHNEAAIILMKYNLIDESVEQFKMALDHKKCIEYICLTSLTDDGRKQLFVELAKKLMTAQRFADAAMIYETQLGDYENAVHILVRSKEFTEALRIAKDRSLGHMVDLCILPEMFKKLQVIKEFVEDATEKFKERLDRLTKLRHMKKHMFGIQMKRNSGLLLSEKSSFRLDCLSILDSDVQSVLSSGTHRSSRSSSSSKSNSSSSTTVTQKQIRKMEKQKQDITEGSKFEDIALMRELHIMISLIFKFGPETKELLLRLIEYSVVELSVLHQHHQRLYNLQVLMKSEVYNIWDEEFRSGTTVTYINENFSYMDEAFRVIPPEVENPGLSWALEMFKD